MSQPNIIPDDLRAELELQLLALTDLAIRFASIGLNLTIDRDYNTEDPDWRPEFRGSVNLREVVHTPLVGKQ